MPSVFPRELYDYTIDYLHNDRPTLYACSLVCTDWLPSSRYHLFTRIEHHLDLQNVQRDLAVLDNPLATIPSYITRLCIDGTEDIEPDSHLFSTLVEGLPRMKHLQVLRLYEMTLTLESSTKTPLYSLLHNIETLELVGVTFLSSNLQTELISSAHSLKTLHLSSLTYGIVNFPVQTRSEHPLTDLVLLDKHSMQSTNTNAVPLFNSITLNSQAVPTLNALELRGISLHSISAICNYVQTLSHTLESIVIECFESAAQKALGDHLDLSRFTSLRSIVFYTPTQNLDALRPMPSIWIQKILSRVSSDRIQKVSFRLDFHEPVDLVRFDLPAVGKLFTGGISSLSTSTTKIQFELASRYIKTSTHEWHNPIIHHLPSLLADRVEFAPLIK